MPDTPPPRPTPPHAAGPPTSAALEDDPAAVVGLLLDSVAALSRALDADLRAQAGTPLGTYQVLVRLGRAPARRLRQVELARQLSLTTGGITRLVDRLEAAGLVRRVAEPTDRRGSYAQLTDAGTALLERASGPHLDSVQRHLVEPLGGPEALAALGAPLRRLHDGLVGGRRPGQDG